MIIGGGLSGLAMGYYLGKKVKRDEILLLEKGKNLGGNIGSEKLGGFIFDRGPKGFLGGGRKTLELVKEIGLWEKMRLSEEESAIRYIWKDGRLNPVPMDLKSIFFSRLVDLGLLKDVLKEYFKGKGGYRNGDESVEEFITRRFSRRVLIPFIEVMVTGIYGGDVRKLSAESIFPRLRFLEREYGSILKGFLKERKVRARWRKAKEDGLSEEIRGIGERRLVSFEGGMGDLIEGLEEGLGVEVEKGVELLGIRYEGGELGVEYRDSRGGLKRYGVGDLIMAVPSYESGKHLKAINVGLSRELEGIEYAPMSVLCFGYREKVHRYKGFGFLSGRGEGLRMLGSIWNDRIFPHMSEEGGVNLTMMYGGACDLGVVGLGENELIDQGLRDLKKVMGIERMPDEVCVFLYERGIPQYNRGHSDRVRRIRGILKKERGIHVLGNYIDGVGVNDCIRLARDLYHELEGL